MVAFKISHILALASAAAAAPTELLGARATVAHDSIAPVEERIKTGDLGNTNKGQTYARAGTVDGKPVVMYAWYMPKDQPLDGDTAGGHRHDWENIVIQVDDPKSKTPKIVAAAASSHGGYSKAAGGAPPMQGNGPKVEYFTSFPTNHELQFTDTVGKTYPISDWDAMPQPAQRALQDTSFGSANVPFKDGNFESKVREALA
ncbi:hypothetical protein KVR01_003549 [Diaporthe batatas]|uniref:uncharacterized protein n=1 Tax=Diaporthe batatas TaxID=748121 RepID=UPI001D058FF8|nr:uncharacterized protein KVR01_003549 [Diaporthe batatas]KAG8167860.1 hypothetical protein KVR01_003549 [Diaporthe batatas]